MSTPRHLLPVHDPLGEPHWLLRGPPPRGLPPYATDHYRPLGATWLDAAFLRDARRELGALCPACLRGEACGAWRGAELDAEGFTVRPPSHYRPRVGSRARVRPNPTESNLTAAEARAVLGLGAAFTPDELKAAFRRAALANHPDRGGNPAAMQRAVEARDVLAAGGGAPTASSPPPAPSGAPQGGARPASAAPQQPAQRPRTTSKPRGARKAAKAPRKAPRKATRRSTRAPARGRRARRPSQAAPRKRPKAAPRKRPKAAPRKRPKTTARASGARKRPASSRRARRR